MIYVVAVQRSVITWLHVWKHLAIFLARLTDPDVWMKPGRKSDDLEYYEYVLLYVDDCLAISENPKALLEQIDNLFNIIASSIPNNNIQSTAIPKDKTLD